MPVVANPRVSEGVSESGIEGHARVSHRTAEARFRRERARSSGWAQEVWAGPDLGMHTQTWVAVRASASSIPFPSLPNRPGLALIILPSPSLLSTLQGAAFISEAEFAEEVEAVDATLAEATDVSRDLINAFVETSSEVNPQGSLESHLEVIELHDTDIAHLDIPDVNDAEVDDLLARTDSLHNSHIVSFAEEFAQATAQAHAVLAQEAAPEAAPKQAAVDPVVAAAEAEMHEALDSAPKDPIDLSDLEPIPEL